MQSSQHEERYKPFLLDIKETKIDNNQSQQINVNDYISDELIKPDQIQSTLPVNYEPTQLTGELVCSICGKRMYELRESICGCIVCQDCQEKQGSICQIHQVPYKFKQPTEQDYQYYDNLTFQCPYYVAGCNEILTLRNFIDHMNTCPYATIRCPYCHIPTPRRKFQKHYESCQMLPCICKFCNQQFQMSQIAEHIEQCHPVCQYCNSRIVNQQDHEQIICPINGCGVHNAKCVLYMHLLDTNYGSLHFQAFNKLIQTSQKQIIQDEQELQTKEKILNKRKQIIESTQQIKVELKYMRLQTQRLILISQKSQLKLPEFANYMSFKEKDALILELLKRIVDQCISYDPNNQDSQQYYFLENGINFIFNNSDSNYQLVTNRCSKQQYIDYISQQPEMMEQIDLSQFQNSQQQQQQYYKYILLNLQYIIQKYLVLQKVDDIGQLQRYHNQCYIQYSKLLLFLSNLIQKTAMPQKQKQIIQSSLTLFQIAFNQTNDLQIYQFLQKDSSYALQDIYKNEYNIQYEIQYQNIIELMQLFDFPVVKFVNYEQQMQYLQHQVAKQVLDKIPRSLLQQYDFIFYGDDEDQKESEEQIFIQKLLIRACYYPDDSYASRVLIYGGSRTEKFKYLIPQNATKICMIVNDNQKQLYLEDLITSNNQIQEIIIKQQHYNQDIEITNQYCLQPILNSKSLQVLTIENMRFSGVDFNMINLENLIELNIINCEVCYLSQIQLNNKELKRLILQLQGNENRIRLYETNCITLAKQINQCKQIQQLTVSFNNNFKICPAFIRELLSNQNNQDLRKYDILRIENVQLDQLTCEEMRDQIANNNIQIISLSLSGNKDIRKFMNIIEQILVDSDCEEFYIENMGGSAPSILKGLESFKPDQLRLEKIYCNIDKLIDDQIVSQSWIKMMKEKYEIEFQ